MKALVLQSDTLRLEVLPECGGKIRSLVDRGTGAEWMWCNPDLPQRTPEYAESFEAGLDTGGWDELFPTVAPCALDGVSVPDHGDLVSLPWEVLGHGAGSLSMQCTARSSPATLRREIRLADGSPAFDLEYTLTNEAGRSVPFLFATHPLFGLEPGSRLELPDDAVLRIAGALGEVMVDKTMRACELNALLDGDSGAWGLKVFSEPGALSAVALRRPDGTGIGFSWDPALLPVLGMWVNNGAWSGAGGAPYHNIGIEPGNASCDSLADAVREGSAGMLAPGEVRRWKIRAALV